MTLISFVKGGYACYFSKTTTNSREKGEEYYYKVI
jgi:hypothetical protein